MISIDNFTNRYLLHMDLSRVGHTMHITMTSGNAPVGAVAIASPQLAQTGHARLIPTTSGHAYERHVASKVGLVLAKATDSTVTVKCGLDLEDACENDVQAVYDVVDDMLDSALASIELESM